MANNHDLQQLLTMDDVVEVYHIRSKVRTSKISEGGKAPDNTNE